MPGGRGNAVRKPETVGKYLNNFHFCILFEFNIILIVFKCLERALIFLFIYFLPLLLYTPIFCHRFFSS